MMREAASNWIWTTPFITDTQQYVVVKWKTGHYYAGPVEAAMALPSSLVDMSTMQYHTRADALRIAMESTVLS